MKANASRLFLTNLDFSREVFAYLREKNYREGQGTNRLGYSAQTKQAADYLCRRAQKEFDAAIYQDIAGTRYIVLDPKNPTNRSRQALLTGSHLDAVPKGGQYDGMAGIVSGLEVMRAIARSNQDPIAPLVTVAFPNEESSRFEFATSSKLLVGQLNSSSLEKTDALGSGETLLQSMCLHHELDEAAIRTAVQKQQKLFAPETVAAFVEAHIQQNDQLAQDGFDLGLVTGVKGNCRCGRIKFIGRADHSGACLQENRSDAGIALGYYIYRLDSELAELRKAYPDLTLSVGDVEGPQSGSVNTVCEQTSSLFDIRSENADALRQAHETMWRLKQEIGREKRIEIIIDETQVNIQQPVVMDRKLIESFNRVANEIGLKTTRTPSGPGHDAAIMQSSVPSIILFSPHKGGSHHPAERMTIHEGDDPFALKGPYGALIKALYGYSNGHVVAPNAIEAPERDSPSPFVRGLLTRGARKLDFLSY